jgi:pimeloyl-ACP methyl ester carboxylesterase
MPSPDAVVVAGVRSPLIDMGPRSSDAVVFIHGNPGSSLDWQDLLREVSGFGRAIALDMPGYGRADKPRDFDYTVPGYAGHLAGALEQLGVLRAHLVLHDFGGPWGLAWAARHPTQVASLTLINIGVMPDYRWHYLARIWRTPVIGEIFMATATRSAFRLLVKHGNPRGLPAGFVDRMFEQFDRGTRRAVLRLYRATSDFALLARAAGQTLTPLNLPVLVLWGARDPYVPVRFAQQQRQVFPQAEVIVLEDSGHWPFVDNPDAVARALIPFLRTQLARSPRGAEPA